MAYAIPRQWKKMSMVLLCLTCVVALLTMKSFVLIGSDNILLRQEDRPFGMMFLSKMSSDHYANIEMKPTVFILASLRTGSSFTGAVLSSYPGAFYLFEPLHAITCQYSSGKYKYATFFNDTKVLVTDSFIDNLQKEELRALATCDFERLPYEMFFGELHSKHQDSLASFITCAHGKSVQYALGCLRVIREKCLTAPLRVMKFIRLRMSQVKDVLDLYSHVKIIHLIRDPRGIALSRLQTFAGGLFDFASNYCRTLRNDLEDKARIFGNYSYRIHTLRYESLANFPLKFTRVMLQFINRSLNLTETMERYIRGIAMGGTSWNCKFCVKRGNAGKIASKWRLAINEHAYNGINAICADILDIFGYNSFQSIRDVRNLTIPLLANLRE